MLTVGDRGQAVDPRLGDKDDAAAMPAVAAAGTTERDVFLSAEGHAAIPPFAGLDFDFDAIDKHARLLSLREGSVRSQHGSPIAHSWQFSLDSMPEQERDQHHPK
jgi:hypothetical protein